MDDFERMIRESENFNKDNLDRKKAQIEAEVRNYEFKNLLDAVELLFELRAKREKSIKDQALIKIIEEELREQPFQYMDEDFILSEHR
jgi:hypothetical protein